MVIKNHGSEENHDYEQIDSLIGGNQNGQQKLKPKTTVQLDWYLFCGNDDPLFRGTVKYDFETGVNKRWDLVY